MNRMNQIQMLRTDKKKDVPIGKSFAIEIILIDVGRANGLNKRTKKREQQRTKEKKGERRRRKKKKEERTTEREGHNTIKNGRTMRGTSFINAKHTNFVSNLKGKILQFP